MKSVFTKDSRFGPREIELELFNDTVNQFKVSQYVDKGRINDPAAHDYDLYCEHKAQIGHVRIAAADVPNAEVK